MRVRPLCRLAPRLKTERIMNKKEPAQLIKKAYDLGAEYERTYKGCGQCLVGAVLDTLEIERDELFKSVTALAGGIGMQGDGSCGGYLGGILLLGDCVGREKSDFADAPGVRFKSYALAQKFRNKFIETYGSVTCRDIQIKTFGRAYYLPDPDEFVKFEAAGGHADKCPDVVGRSAAWVVELMAEEGLL